MNRFGVALTFACSLAASPVLAGEAEQINSAVPRWIHDGEFKGQRILLAAYYPEVLPYVPGILRQMGFTVDVRQEAHLPALKGYDQLWVVSSCGSAYIDGADAAKVKAFAASGKGVYVLTDNTPCTGEGNVLGKALHGIYMEGDYIGEQMIHVVAPGTVEKLVAEAKKSGDLGKLAELRRAGYLNGKLYAEDHELLSGIEKIYEGVTICHMTDSPDLEVILRASDNQSLVAVTKKKSETVVYDCGFTRMYNRWDEHAATATRWYQNVAAYLAGKRRGDLPTTTQSATPATPVRGG